MTTTTKIALKWMSLLDDDVSLIVELFCFEETITNGTNCLQARLSNSSNHSEALTRTDQPNVAKLVYNELTSI